MQRLKSCSLMAVFKLADEHPLTKAGLRRLYVVEAAERVTSVKLVEIRD